MTQQDWDPETYATHAGFVAEFGRDVLELLAPRAGERVLDLGCGDGALTERLVRAGCSVVGIDSSPGQVAAACARGIDARVGRGEDLAFENEFDAVFSNAALHWMPAANVVVHSVCRALRSGGRFVGELVGAGNVDTIRQALAVALAQRGLDANARDPWLFPTVAWYRALLERHGFEVRYIQRFSRVTTLPTDMAGWLNTFAQPFLFGFDQDVRREIIDDVCRAVRPDLYDAEHGWTADYVRLRFAALRLA